MAVSPLEERYSTEMNAVFDEENKLRKWLECEVALAYAHAKAGDVSRRDAEEIERASKKVGLGRVKQIEAEIHHDLMAMVRALGEKCAGGSGKCVHLGATSYDIEDTATALLLRDAFAIIKKHVHALDSTLVSLAKRHAGLVCVGRTHGQHAVPTTYGMKFALWRSELRRHSRRIEECEQRLYVGKLSGAVGTMAALGPKAFEIEKEYMRRLNLKPAVVTNQVVQRDRHAEALGVLALIAATLEKIAKEIRSLQRTEIGEVAEPFGSKQVGSSAMPQKRNPHKSERVCSLARVVRADLQVAIENIALEHERDLTNSANERIIFPEAFILTDYMLKETNAILSGLQFFPENIERNLKMGGGAIMSERVVGALVEKGMARQEAHELLRTAAIAGAQYNKPLFGILLENKRVRDLLGEKEMRALFNEESYIGKAEEIIKRALSE